MLPRFPVLMAYAALLKVLQLSEMFMDLNSSRLCRNWQFAQTKQLEEDAQAVRSQLAAAEARLADTAAALGEASAAQLQPALEQRLAELEATSGELREVRRKLSASQAAAAAAEREAEAATRRGDELRRALGAAEEGSRKLEGELHAERAALQEARSDAHGAHAEAAQRKQVRASSLIDAPVCSLACSSRIVEKQVSNWGAAPT